MKNVIFKAKYVVYGLEQSAQFLIVLKEEVAPHARLARHDSFLIDSDNAADLEHSVFYNCVSLFANVHFHAEFLLEIKSKL